MACETMGRQVYIRLSDQTLQQIDRYAAQLTSEPSVQPSRSAAIRVLIHKALEQAGLPVEACAPDQGGEE
jgi:uncharacterized protein YciW